MSASEIYQLTASQATPLLRSGELTVEKWVTSLLEHIASRDTAVNAWAHLDPTYALEQAKALDAIPLSDRGPLHGVPIGVKDVILTKGNV
jgi:Asp-tRNA(Asn)/Glu-tRNA(Gln) amidotransferase A subunit family amidase